MFVIIYICLLLYMCIRIINNTINNDNLYVTKPKPKVPKRNVLILLLNMSTDGDCRTLSGK